MKAFSKNILSQSLEETPFCSKYSRISGSFSGGTRDGFRRSGGEAAGGAAAALGDVIGYLLKPTGPYFPGFTVSAFLTGLVYGFLFYKKEVTWQRALAASLIISVAVNLGLDTLWLSMLYGQGYIAILVGRLVKFPLAVAIQTVLVPLVYRLIVKRLPSAIRS